MIRDTSISMYRMPPGTIMPEHEDTYPRFKELFDVEDVNKICRILVSWMTGSLVIILS